MTPTAGIFAGGEYYVSCTNNFAGMPNWVQKVDFPDLPLPTFITIHQPYLIPESIEYDGTSFLVSSVGSGAITRVRNDYSLRVLTPPNPQQNLFQSLGIEVDRAGRGILHVANGRVPSSTDLNLIQASYVQINLTTGAIIRGVDLSQIPGSKPHIANDVAVDAAGNAYLTDSTNHLVWKVTPDGTPSSFFSSPEFDSPITDTNPYGVGLDGIEYHPDGYLILGKLGDAKVAALYKLVISTQTLTTISVKGGVAGADGIIFSPNTTDILYVVGNNQVAIVTTKNDWKSAKAVHYDVPAGCITPTAGVFVPKSGNSSHCPAPNSAYDFYVTCTNIFGAGPYQIAKVSFSGAPATAPLWLLLHLVIATLLVRVF
jgi:hypothetical protein